MKPRLNLLFLLVAFIISSPSSAQSTAQLADPVVLTDEQNRYPLGLHLEILKDPNGNLTIQDVTRPAYQDQFIPSQEETPNFGFQDAPYWVRFQAANRSEQTSSWILELGFSNMHYMDLYLPTPDGTGYRIKESGVLRPYDSRDFPFHHLSFNLDIPPGSEQTVYIRFQNQASMTLPLQLWAPGSFFEHSLQDNLVFGAFYGILLIMAFYNASLLYLIKERVYLYLVLFILAAASFYFFYDAWVYQFKSIPSPRWAMALTLVFLGISFFALVKFVDWLLDLKNQAPKLHFVANIYAGITALLAIAALFIEYRIIAEIQVVVILIIVSSILVLTFYFWRLGARPVKYLFASWVWFLAGAILTGTARLGILPSTAFTEDLTRFGLVWMVGLWSLALADRVNALKSAAETSSHQLQESEGRLAQFLEAMPVGVVVYGTDFKPQFLNQEALQLLTDPGRGIHPDTSFQRNLGEAADYYAFRFTGTDQPYPLEQLPATRAMREGKPATSDDVEIRLGDRRIPTGSWASPLFDSNGNVTGAIVAFRDISDRLDAEKILRESEGRFRSTFEQAAVGIAHVSPEGHFLRINQRFCEIVEYSRDEMMARTFQEITHPDDLEADIKLMESLLSGAVDSYSLEKRYIRKNGLPVWVNLTVALLREETGEPKYFISVIQDITERKIAEDKLQFQAHLLEVIEQAVIVTDMEGRVVFWNPAAEQIYGWPAEEALGKTTIELISSEQSLQHGAEIMRRLKSGKSWSGEYLARSRDGSLLPVQVTNTPLYDEQGLLHRIIGISSDISKRKQAEEALRQSEELQRLALEGAQMGIWANDLLTGAVVWDTRTREIFGVALDEPASLELGFSLIHPDDREKAQKAYEQAIATQSNGLYREEKRILRPDGQVRWIATRGIAVFVDRGAKRRAVRLVGIVMDVTEQVVTGQMLEESLSRYRVLVETMNEGLGVSDDEDLFTYVNPRLLKMLGYTEAEMIGQPVTDFFTEDGRQIVANQLSRRRRGQAVPYIVVWRRKDGSELHTRITPAAMFDPQGQYLRSIAVVTDISEEIKASQLLDRRVQERTHELSTLLDVSQVLVSTLELEPLLKAILVELKSVVNFTGAAIFSLADRNLATLDFPLQIEKKKAVKITGPLIHVLNNSDRFNRGEAIMIPDVREDTNEGLDFRRFASEFLDIDFIEIRTWLGVPLKVKEKLIGILSIHHNQPGYYSEEKVQLAYAFANQAAVAIENAQLYRQAQIAAASEERSRLARELHDSVTQALYSLTLYAGAARAALSGKKIEVAEKNLDEVVAIAREAMGDLRLLIFELRPPMLEKEGLIVALKSRLEAVEARSGIQADLQVEGQPNLSSEAETEIYWSVTEGLNNVIKHARAKHVFLNLRFQNGSASITIRDDGVGFDVTGLQASTGWGLKSIAERVEKLGGRFKVESRQGEGTVFEVRLGE